MANLTPCFSTLRYIVPVASSGPTLSQYVPSLATMQMPCPHLLRVTHECIVYSLHSSFLNIPQSLRHGMQLICLTDLDSEAPVLKSEFCIRGLEGRFAFCFWHLLAEIFGAISLCSFWKGRLKENHLSAVTGRGVDLKVWCRWGRWYDVDDMCDGQNSIHVVKSWHRFIRPPIATHSPSTLFTN